MLYAYVIMYVMDHIKSYPSTCTYVLEETSLEYSAIMVDFFFV